MNLIILILFTSFLYTVWYLYVVHGSECITKFGLPVFILLLSGQVSLLVIIVYLLTIEADPFIIAMLNLVPALGNFICSAMWIHGFEV